MSCQDARTVLDKKVWRPVYVIRSGRVRRSSSPIVRGGARDLQDLGSSENGSDTSWAWMN